MIGRSRSFANTSNSWAPSVVPRLGEGWSQWLAAGVLVGGSVVVLALVGPGHPGLGAAAGVGVGMASVRAMSAVNRRRAWRIIPLGVSADEARSIVGNVRLVRVEPVGDGRTRSLVICRRGQVNTLLDALETGGVRVAEIGALRLCEFWA